MNLIKEILKIYKLKIYFKPNKKQLELFISKKKFAII